MAPIAHRRLREWVWGHPAKARAAVAGGVLLAVAAGAFLVVRPDASSERQRHGQYSGSTEANGGFEGDDLDGSGAPTIPSEPSVGTPAGGPAGTAGPGTTAVGLPTKAGATGAAASDPAAGGVGSSTSTTTSTTTEGRGTTRPQPATATTPTTGQTGGTRTGSPVTATAGPGWGRLPKAPIGPRMEHAAIWTGREMVVWGGTADYTEWATDGAAYDPAARTWRKLPAAPFAPRSGAQVFWTGQEMLVFGGSLDGEAVADGAAWNPATNTWRSIPASPTGPRDGAVVAWAGDRLVIWSGNTVAPSDADDFVAEVKNDGAAYVPATNSWVPVGSAPIPPRSGAQSAWSGGRLVVSGGEGEADDRSDGAAFDPVSGAWSPIAARPQPGSCGGDIACSGIWTGTTVLFPASGLAYDPAADRWSPMADRPGAEAPAPGEPAVWSGRLLLAWGVPGDEGDGSGADPVDTGDGGDGALSAAATYDPVNNRWQPFPVGPLRGRAFHTAVWTGDAMLIWGGIADDEPQGDGAAYRPE